MYRDFFRLREYPFSLTPDTDFWFDTASHRDAINVVCASLRGGEGFIKITAEIGLGKTLLCRKLLRELDGQFQTAYLPDPQLSANGLRRALADELGVQTPGNCAGDRLLNAVRNRLLELAREGTQVVLLIDEAHQLPNDTLEGLRLLTNLETEKAKLLQVVILGQPELDRRLAQPRMRQLKQRIGFSCTLSPMSETMTADYIRHRLAIAGDGHEPRFDDAAVRMVVNASQGTPRLINVLCHKALMAAYGCGEKCITRTHVKRAILDTESVMSRPWNPLAAMSNWLAPRLQNRTRHDALHGVGR